MLVPAVIAAVLLAEGKYGAFSPSMATVQTPPTQETVQEALKRLILEHANALEACASMLDRKIPRWRYEAVGGTITVLLGLDAQGKPTKDMRVVRPIVGNAKTNECMLRTIRGVAFGARAWPRPLGYVVVVDTQCEAQEVGNDFIDVTCKGKYRGVYDADAPKK